MELFHKMLIDGLESCGLFVDYFNVVINSHSDGTHTLQRVHWRVSDVMLHLSKSFPKKKQTHHMLDGLRVSKYKIYINE